MWEFRMHQRMAAALWVIAAVFSGCLLLPVRASARGPVEFTLGMKAGAGGDLWTAAENVPRLPTPTGDNTEVPLFDGTRAGFNYTVGLFGQLRLFTYLGIETGLLLTRRRLVEEVTFTFTDANALRTFKTKTRETLTWGTIRVPIMLKFMVPVGRSTVWFGVGPEFQFGRWAEGELKEVAGDGLNAPKQANFAYIWSDMKRVQPKKVNDTYITWGLGFEVAANDRLQVPIDLRFGYNLSQSKNWRERAAFDAEPPFGNPTTLNIKARSSFYVEILVGLTYNLF